MNTIEKAKAALNEAKEFRAVEVAQAYAAIAQAEQLKRIADCLNAMASTTAGIEDALYSKRGLISPDPQDYSTREEFEKAEDLYIYRRDAAAGMSLEEWRAYTKDWGKDTDDEAEARTDYADPLN